MMSDWYSLYTLAKDRCAEIDGEVKRLRMVSELKKNRKDRRGKYSLFTLLNVLKFWGDKK
jgi:hypothetical protein